MSLYSHQYSTVVLAVNLPKALETEDDIYTVYVMVPPLTSPSKALETEDDIYTVYVMVPTVTSPSKALELKDDLNAV